MPPCSLLAPTHFVGPSKSTGFHLADTSHSRACSDSSQPRRAQALSQEGVSVHSWVGVRFQSLAHSVAPRSKASRSPASSVPWEI